MAVAGLAQVSIQHPELLPRYRAPMQSCLDWMISPDGRKFGTEEWGTDGLAITGDQPHHAYLGYLGLALGLYRIADSNTHRYDDIHASLAEALAERSKAPLEEYQTYPGETYPPDIAMSAAAVGLFDLSTGADHGATLRDWGRRLRRGAIDSESGLLVQRLDPASGAWLDLPRGSGTALAAYALRYSHPRLSAELYGALQRRDFLLFGGILESPGTDLTGDIDSGPVILGVGVSATGFSLGGARMHSDRVAWRQIMRTATLFGVPIRGRYRTTEALGFGGLADAIMLAMTTAPSTWPPGDAPTP